MNAADEKIYRESVEALEAFGYWYRTTGHWIYPNRKHALDTWEHQGIDGLPEHPREPKQ